MHTANVSGVLVENSSLKSDYLDREVMIDYYIPSNFPSQGQLNLLLINDGQDMTELGLQKILGNLYSRNSIEPVFCVAIHAGLERKMEYGIAAQPDFKGRGAKAGLYTSFILHELMLRLNEFSFGDKAFAGFSLGGLSALDIAWNHPGIFSKAAVFSGSLWWRSIDQTHPQYKDHLHRIMHQQIRDSSYKPGLKFFFQCGNMDETRDRNKNGIIDSIDDTRDLILELEGKGYDPVTDIQYLELADGKHDIATWGRAFPDFLKWAFPWKRIGD